MSKSYREKLKSVEWQKKRLNVLSEARWRCRECGIEKEQLQVHHVLYLPGRDPWDYPDHLLLCLCDRCHVERQHIELKVFSNVAEILENKTIEDIKRQPIWTMFCNEKPEGRNGHR